MRFLPIKRVYFFWLLAFGFWLLASCSQHKNTFTSRAYHNLTAHYNGLFWANVNLNEAIANIEKAHKDDYNKLLPVFKYADEKAAKANAAQLDKAIQKTHKVIDYHSMLINGHEYCKWIDNNYMTMGVAQFYKRDYYAGILIFDYVVKMFGSKDTKYDAFLWLIRSYNQMNSVIKTGPILDLLKHDSKMPKRLRGDYFAVLSDYYMRTEEYKKAAESLVKAIPFGKTKNVRARYTYILAQLCERDGNLKRASMYYGDCANLHPIYEMEFNARLSKARTFQLDNGEGTKELKRELTKMLKDGKNKEYRDQIYYALGDVAFRENNIHDAMDFFKSSVRTSVSNNEQKALSYLRIADIYFDQRVYRQAGLYYDSTMNFLSKDYKNYDLVKSKKESLSSLIRNMNIIDREDSLLKIAKMDTAKIGKLVDGIIAKVIDDEKKKKEEEERRKNQSKNSSDNSLATLGNSGSWYFYNQATMSSGLADFFKKWGSRSLEDNWRRSNKQSVMPADVETDTTTTVAQADTAKGVKKIPPDQTREFYTKNIPFTDEQQQKANAKIVDAYYNLGSIYKEDLNDEQKSAETFEELLKRYPDSKYTANLYYLLYRIYISDNETDKANYYKDKILKEYPNSEYAKIILNPDYQKNLQASQNEIEKFYTKTYSAYNEGKCSDVISMVTKADSFYSASELMPKFALMRAFCIGKTQGVNDYKNALQGIIAKYPKDGETKKKAQELLDFLKNRKITPIDSIARKDTVKKVILYTFKDSAEHECIIIISAKKLNMEEFKIRIANFNAKYAGLLSLTSSSILLDAERQIVIIKSFPTAARAKDYYDFLNQDAEVFKDISLDDYKVFPISAENFAVFYKEKNVSEYQQFFLENYVKKKDE